MRASIAARQDTRTARGDRAGSGDEREGERQDEEPRSEGGMQCHGLEGISNLFASIEPGPAPVVTLHPLLVLILRAAQHLLVALLHHSPLSIGLSFSIATSRHRLTIFIIIIIIKKKSTFSK